jgi:ATP-dependent helicase YprA (DUF1998 family)
VLNPITYTEAVVGDFLRYQLTTYPFADAQLHAQMRTLLNLEQTRNTPLLKGPFVSLSRAFRKGTPLAELARQNVLHPHVEQLSPHPCGYYHQEEAWRAIADGMTTLVATGTGSGKSECFLYPIISHCLKLRDAGAPDGIVAVLVYPMNALAEDQLGRLRGLLAGTGISFGMYVGKTPEDKADVVGKRLREGSTLADYQGALKKSQKDKHGHAVHPAEERPSRAEMRATGGKPRILLTNVKQLELLLTRQRDVDLFDGADLKFIVFDEAHTFTGAHGAETAALIRRLRAFCGKTPDEVVCVATSATIADPVRGTQAGGEFAERFFGVDPRRVKLIGARHEDDRWATTRTPTGALAGDPGAQLQNVLEAVRAVEVDAPPAEAVKKLTSIVTSLTGRKLDARGDWQRALYEVLASNEVVFQTARALEQARSLTTLVDELTRSLGRAVSEEEVLIWLALGAVARDDGRPLLRPVVHGFVRGMQGAVVTFPSGDAPRLWLSRAEAQAQAQTTTCALDVTTCTTCGQHYFAHTVEDFAFPERGPPTGGRADADGAFWPAQAEGNGGVRVVLVDRLIGGDDADVDDLATAAGDAPPGTARLWLCRGCGSLHRDAGNTCRGCGRAESLVALLVIRQSEDNPGQLTRCLSCGANGRRVGSTYREPARPVRAVTVSDVHVLGQNMLHHAERRRLIIFADNRQDAAFQAGWMQDHARRYRLRALMYEHIKQGAVSVGDLVATLDARLDRDEDLSQALLPEVWRRARKEAAGQKHSQERKYFLRIQVLREITNGLRQRIGLEPWGRVLPRYLGLDGAHPFFQQWAPRAGCTASELAEAAAILLDISRRAAVLYDGTHQIFTRWWGENTEEVAFGYIPASQGGPKALKLERDGDDAKGRINQWLSDRGQTRAVQLARKWGIPDDLVDEFLRGLWALLADEWRLLVPVTLTNQYGKALPGAAGACQIDGDKLLLEAHTGVLQCQTCRRSQLRVGPRAACVQWRCRGTVRPIAEDPDNYDLRVLDEGFALVRPREHSAQVPHDEREQIERQFKGDGEAVNTLVATPTLELGVDIGSLDSVLMRNVPPLTANYWQRAGRAGRRHRMAVNLTYAGTRSHDRAFFDDPLKLLLGAITPPRFNLKNELMVRKHVHATVLSALFQLARPRSALPEDDRQQIATAIGAAFPEFVKGYLFTPTGELRRGGFSLDGFAAVIEKFQPDIIARVEAVFDVGWPDADRDVVTREKLRRYVVEMTPRLAEVIQRLEQRVRWALDQIKRLNDTQTRKGVLERDEEALRRRCEELVHRLKGQQQRRRQDAEGYDDTMTWSVLAAEGYLPGYGLEAGNVIAFHQAPRHGGRQRDFELRRSLSMALREYSPGNMLYANGNRFIPRYFHLQAGDASTPSAPLLFQVDTATESVVEHGIANTDAASLGSQYLPAVPMCDVDLPHQSHIADDEDYRFQLSVAVYGQEKDRHGGGRSYRWGTRDVQHRRAVQLRLVNVGATKLVRNQARFGFPLCIVCGQSRSPFASEVELENFTKNHRERCGRPPQSVGFYVDDAADALTVLDCTNRKEAYSVAEALRIGAAEVLDMERDDLQVLVVGKAGQDRVDLHLYDPMPGGSGLLDQMVQRWDEVVAAALRVTEACPSKCAVVCVDCLQNYRNSHAHAHLDRHVAADCLNAWGKAIEFAFEIPPRMPSTPNATGPANAKESDLMGMFQRAGFPTPTTQKRIELGTAVGYTDVDFFFDVPDTAGYDGLCVYLDGLSTKYHGNPEQQAKDHAKREELRRLDFEVIAIAASELTDKAALVAHFRRIGRLLLGKQGAARLEQDTGWYSFGNDAVRNDDVVDAWDEMLGLAREPWRPLLEGLRTAGIPPPHDVDWDLPASGRVSGVQAIAVWNPDGQWVALVDAGIVERGDRDRVLAVNPGVTPADLADELRDRLVRATSASAKKGDGA